MVVEGRAEEGRRREELCRGKDGMVGMAIFFLLIEERGKTMR